MSGAPSTTRAAAAGTPARPAVADVLPTAGEAPPLAQAIALAAPAVQALRDGVPLDRGLEAALARAAARALHPRAAAAARDLAYTATRRRALAAAMLGRLAQRPPTPSVAALLHVALAQLLVQRHAAYAVVDQAVRAAKDDPATQAAAGFVNGVLRNALRQIDQLLADTQADPAVRLNLPPWWLARLRSARPDDWEAIAMAQLQPPPLVLRVNRRRLGVAAAQAQLAAAGVPSLQVGAWALWLTTPRPVDAIPGFAAGDFAVQDAGAQLAAPLLGLEDGMRVLDACAAPGGKTAHLAECADALAIDAVEADAARAPRIDHNLRRLGAYAHARIRVRVGDVAVFAREAQAAGAAHYDRILLDAPCTASGIVRRHPDIPWLRRAVDVVNLATEQARLLEALWPLLRPAGRLLYVVCSLFPEEAAQQIDAFVARHGNARWAAWPAAPGAPGGITGALQLVPSDLALAAPWSGSGGALPSVQDGFFYALIEKS